MVELTGIEPVTQRCERCVIPLYYSPLCVELTDSFNQKNKQGLYGLTPTAPGIYSTLSFIQRM